jgi:hypothetical protein
VRRLFTHGYLNDEARRLRQTCYNPSALISADRAMIEYFQWLAALPQSGDAKFSDGKVFTHQQISRSVSLRSDLAGVDATERLPVQLGG